MKRGEEKADGRSHQEQRSARLAPGKSSRTASLPTSKPNSRTASGPAPLDFSGLAIFRKANEPDQSEEPLTEEDLEPLMTGGDAEAEQAGADRDAQGSSPVAFGDALARSSSRPLDGGVRGQLEARTDQGLGDVRVHTDAKAAVAAKAINAKAFTVGRNIYFAEGEYNPSSREGRRLIAHEVAHAAQSGAGAGQGAVGQVSSPGDATEVEADRFADEFDRDPDGPKNAPTEKAGDSVHRYPGVVDVAFEEDKKRGIDPGNPKSEKVWTEERGYIKNPTATKLSTVVKNGKVTGKFANGKVMYIVDSAGEVWVGHRKGVNMPHPTLIGGKNPEVQAAGMVDIRGGKIVSIDNHSGHFRPPRGALRKAAKAFLKLPKDVFKNLKMQSVHFKKDGTEYWKKFRSLRMLKLKKLDIGKALKRVRMRYKHDPKFRGRIRGAGKAGLGIIVTAIVGYFFGKWLSSIEEKQIRRDIEKLQPKVEAALKRSLEAKADEFDKLFEKDPKSKIHMNLVYRIGYFKYIDPEDGAEKDYHTTEFVSGEFATTPIESGTSYDTTDTHTCGMTNMEWHQLRMSEELEVGDLYDAIGGD